MATIKTLAEFITERQHEFTYATGEPATASVVVAEPSRLFQVDCGALRQFLAKNEDIAMALEGSVSGDLRRKLADTTRRLSEFTTSSGNPAAPARE